MHVNHTIPPIYDVSSNILILGSMPSVVSRNKKSYYAHPQNQFWKLLADVYEENILNKEEFLHRHHIALWDVVKSCEIEGSKDSSIRNVECNDIVWLLKQTKIKRIFITGKKAYQLYQKYIRNETNIDAVYLPSPSPIYQMMKYGEKLNLYKQIRDS